VELKSASAINKTMRSWKAAFREAVHENPKLSATVAFELGLLLYATFKARYGRPSAMPSSADLIEAVPVLALAALAPKARPDRRRTRSRRTKPGATRAGRAR
jgi:hypothetical protein